MSDGASPSPPDSSLDEGEEGWILASINTLLNRVGISAKPINSFEELRKSASSMFVAIFEAMFQVRQKGVVRKPAHVHNYVHNAQMVVDALAGPILNMDLSHITGEAIVRGDTVAIRNLVDIFMGISEVVIKRQARPQGGPPTKRFWTGPRTRPKNRQDSQQRRPLPQRQQEEEQQHFSDPYASSSASRSQRLNRRVYPSPFGLSQPGTRISAQALGSRVRRSRPHKIQDASDVPRTGGNEDGEDEPVVGGEQGGSMGRSELSPFSRESESMFRPEREGLTAGDISEEGRLYGGGGGEPRLDGEEDPSFGRLFTRPLQKTELGLDRNANRTEADREMKFRLYYSGVLKDRLTALRKRELADARKQLFAHKNARHLARVRQIKKERMEQKLRLARLSQRLRYQDEGRGRLSHLYKKILTALHRQRKEDDREDAARLKALHLAWQAQSDDLEKFFNERVELIVEHERSSGRERAQAMASEELDLVDLFHRAEIDYEARLSSQIQQQAVEEAAQERHKAEVQHAYVELLRMEDWSGASKDRFLGVRPNTAFEQSLKQVRVRAEHERSIMRKQKKMRELNRAYGRSA